jgi:hypothetical protein
MKDLKKLVINSFLFFLIAVVADHSVAFVLKRGLMKYYGFDTDNQLLINGASQLMLALDKDRIESETGLKVAKYTREGVNLSDREIMLRLFLDINKNKSKYAIYGTDQFMFTAEGLSLNSYTFFYPFMENPDVALYLRSKTNDKRTYLVHKFIKCSRYDMLLINSSIRGYLEDWSNKKTGELNLGSLEKNISSGNVRKVQIDSTLLSSFHRSMSLLKKNNMEVLLLYLPYAGKLEYNDPKRSEVIEILKNFAETNSGFYFLDYSEFLQINSYFFDPNHLNPTGQKVATDHLIKDFLSNRVRFNQSEYYN